MKTEFFQTEDEMLASKDVSPEAMERLVKVRVFGGDVEKAKGKKSDDNSEDVGQSQQLDEFQQLASGEFVPPKYNPSVWAQAMTQNTRLARCIRSYARNTVGLGWHVEPLHPVTPDTAEKEKKVITEQTEILRNLFNFPNQKMPFSEICYHMKIDEEATGNGYLEVVRNNAGKIVRLYHAPSTTIRRRLLKPEGNQAPKVYGYLQIRGSQKRYFKEFGDKRVMNALTGEFYESENKALPVAERATEILQFMVYDPSSSYYGGPRYVSASPAISGNRQAAIRNVSFFENDAVPRMAVLVSGGHLTQESMQQIEDFVRGKARGSEKAHRVMILQVEASKVGFQQQNKTMIELKPLTVGVTEDASFQTYREANDEEVREIFGMAPVFFSTENVNKASAAVSRSITNEQEFEPDRIAKEYTLNQTVVMDLLTSHLGNDPKTPDDPDEMEEYRSQIRVQLRFARPVLTDPLDQARMDQIYASLGAMTPNELRERINKAHFPKEFLFADKPLVIAMAELAAGIAAAIEGNDPLQQQMVPGAEAPQDGAEEAGRDEGEGSESDAGDAPPGKKKKVTGVPTPKVSGETPRVPRAPMPRMSVGPGGGAPKATSSGANPRAGVPKSMLPIVYGELIRNIAELQRVGAAAASEKSGGADAE